MVEMGEIVVESELSRAFMAISVSLSGYALRLRGRESTQ